MKAHLTTAAATIIATFAMLHETKAGNISDAWSLRLDMGGTIPEDAELTEFDGPVTGAKFRLDPGFQFDVSGGYQVTRWLEIGPEFGFTFNGVDSFGDLSYPDTTYAQVLMFANVRLEYPTTRCPVVPFVGAGIGGVASFLTFGDTDYYYEPDGTGDDFSLGFQAFAGLRYRFGEHTNIGLVYRFLATDRQRFDVEWWDGSEFRVSIDSIRMHSICLVFSAEF